MKPTTKQSADPIADLVRRLNKATCFHTSVQGRNYVVRCNKARRYGTDRIRVRAVDSGEWLLSDFKFPSTTSSES